MTFCHLQRHFCTYALRSKILADEYRNRRAQLIKAVFKSKVKSPITFVQSKRKTFSSPVVPHVFRQCSNFRYLTGFDATDIAQLIFSEKESVFFTNERSDTDVLWNGKTLNSKEIIAISGVDRVLPFSEFETYMASTVRSDSTLVADMESLKLDSHFDIESKNAYKLLLAIPMKIPISNFLDELRWKKSDAEIEIMRATCKIGSQVINSTISQAKSFTNESHIVGALEFEARRRGAQFLAYPPVVASGVNANTIHYISSRENLKSKDCVLIDAGCDVEGYISDITRCFPQNGKFSDAQRVLYEALLHIQTQLLDYVNNVRPLKLNELYVQMIRQMSMTLDEIMFFKDSMVWDEIVTECDKLCPHHVGHYLGMDIHDSPTVAKNIEMIPGVVFTVEPGIYVHSNNNKVQEHFRGIGFRIEDDVLITESGSEVLTKDCVRNIHDIELLMS